MAESIEYAVSCKRVERQFRIDVLENGSCVILALFGELDVASSTALEAELARARERECVIVDLRELDFIDSTGLGVLVKEHRHAQENGGRLAVVRGTGQVERLLSLTGLADQMPVADSREELLSET
jgi:anti-anti-sigma factor